jgi:hypothetical protein
MRRFLIALLIAALPLPALAGDGRDVMLNWYKLVLELVRHTPTYSPPVASRAFAYLGVTSYEVMASGGPEMTSLAGQLTDLPPLPKASGEVDEGVVMHAALARQVAQHGQPFQAPCQRGGCGSGSTSRPPRRKGRQHVPARAGRGVVG